jgi:hypothetical protein
MVYLEAEDPERIVAALAASEEPFDPWFKERLLECHGRDLAWASRRVAAKLVSPTGIFRGCSLASGKGPS